MQFSQLATVKHRVAVGRPLPFNVRNADHTLLLARGQVVDTFDQLEALFTRGALVDLAELRNAHDSIKDAPRRATAQAVGPVHGPRRPDAAVLRPRKASARRWTMSPARCRR